MEPPGIPGRFSLSVESGPCPRLGVDRVGLAPLTSHGPIRAIDLDHFDARCGQVAGEAGTIGACAFDTYSSKLAEAAHPGQEVAITLGTCRELGRLEDPASIVDHGAHGDIFMGAPPADDNLLCFCHAWSCLPLMPMGEAPPAGTDGQDSHGAGQGSYQVTSVRPAVHISGGAWSTDQQQGTRPVTHLGSEPSPAPRYLQSESHIPSVLAQGRG